MGIRRPSLLLAIFCLGFILPGPPILAHDPPKEPEIHETLVIDTNLCRNFGHLHEHQDWKRLRRLRDSAKRLAVKAKEDMGFLFLLVTAGAIYKAFTSAPTAPLETKAQQLGNQVFQPLTDGIQIFLIDPSLLPEYVFHLKGRLYEAHKARERAMQILSEIQKMDAEELRYQWPELQIGFQKSYQRYQQYLPDNLRQGRKLITELVSNQLSYFAGTLASMDTQYQVHWMQYKDLKKREESGNMSEGEKKEMQDHERQMKAARDRIAGTLASYKLYCIMYKEYTGVPLEARINEPLGNVWEVFNSSMRFDSYDSYYDGMNQVIDKLRISISEEDRKKDLFPAIPGAR